MTSALTIMTRQAENPDEAMAAQIYTAMLLEKLAEHQDPQWAAEHPPTIQTLCDVGWWREAREKLIGLPPSDNGSIYCQIWSRTMHEHISKALARHPEWRLRLDLMYSTMDDHWWLQMQHKDTAIRYIFDGTAAQKFPQNPDVPIDGLYGTMEPILGKIPGAGFLYSHGEVVEPSEQQYA